MSECIGITVDCTCEKSFSNCYGCKLWFQPLHSRRDCVFNPSHLCCEIRVMEKGKRYYFMFNRHITGSKVRGVSELTLCLFWCRCTYSGLWVKVVKQRIWDRSRFSSLTDTTRDSQLNDFTFQSFPVRIFQIPTDLGCFWRR